MTIVVVRDVVEGTLGEIVLNSDEDVKGVVIGEESVTLSTTAASITPVLGDTVKAILDKDGEALEVNVVVSTAEPTNYALVLGLENGKIEEETLFGKTEETVTLPQVKVLLPDGETAVYDLDDELTVVTTASGTDVVLTPSGLTVNDVVKYELDEDGVISVLEVATLGNLSGSFDSDLNLIAGSALVNEDTIIFNIGASTKDVAKVSELGDSVTATAILADDDTVEVLVVSNGVTVPSVDDTFAVVLSKGKVLNADDDTVYKVKALVDGKEVVYYTTKDATNTSRLAVDTAVTLEFDGDEIDNVNTVSADASTTVAAIVGNLVKLGNTYYEISDSVVVYDMSDVANDGVVVGDFDDVVKEADIEIYETNSDNDGYDVIIINSYPE